MTTDGPDPENRPAEEPRVPAPRPWWDNYGMGLGLTAVLHVVAAAIAMALWFFADVRDPSFGDDWFFGLLIMIWMAQFLYITAAAVVALILGYPRLTVGLAIGFSVTLLLIPTICFGSFAVR